MKLYFIIEYCVRFDVVRVLVEVNLEKLLLKKIYFKGKEGQDVIVWDEFFIFFFQLWCLF